MLQLTISEKKIKLIQWIDFNAKSQKWPLLEEIFDDSMETTSDSLQLGELASVAEEERYQKDVVAETDKKFQIVKIVLFLFILSHSKLKNVKIIPSDKKGIRIYPSEVRLILTTFDIVVPISARHSDMNYLKDLLKLNVL